jgi:CheY-like chemotaxis protein
VAVVLDLDPGLDPVRVDPGQFQAALLNLAGNARDAMPDGGTLTVTTRNLELGPDAALDGAEAPPGPYVAAAVSDTGRGMEAATAARAFEPFFTTKEVGRGTGLGLSQVYGSARQAGGFCRLRSSPGAGCTVEIVLPRSAEAGAGEAAAATMPLRRAAGGEVVLVVEDEDALRDMAAERLQALGYRVLPARDARAALDILRGDARIDIPFSAVVMPGGMNGAQLAAEAGSIRPGLKVLLTSGYTTTATGGTRELPPGVPLLRKPYLREDLAAKLHTVLAS